MLDEWNDQISSTASGLQLLRINEEAGEPPLFSLDHRAEFLSQYVVAPLFVLFSGFSLPL